MEAEEERYEINFDETINNDKVKGLAIDICPKGQEPYTEEPSIIFMSEDKGTDEKGNEIGHEPFGYIEFKDIDNLKLAQMGLELIQEAIGREVESEDH